MGDVAAEYWLVLLQILPVVFVGAFVAVALNFLRIITAPTLRGRLAEAISVIAVGGVSAGVTALGVSLFMEAPSAETTLFMGAVAGSSGQKIFDIYSRRLFGVYVDTNRPRD